MNKRMCVGGHCTKDQFQARCSSWFQESALSLPAKEMGVNYVGKCRRKLMLVEHLTGYFNI